MDGPGVLGANMATFKRKRANVKNNKRTYKKTGSKSSVTVVVIRLLKSHDKKMCETKTSQTHTTDGRTSPTEIMHNYFVQLLPL